MLDTSKLEWNTPDKIGPGAYSWFHIIWLAFTIITVFILIKLHYKKKNKIFDEYVILTINVLIIISQLFKQYFWFSYYHYIRLDTLPLQFCSVPPLIGLAAFFIKNEKIKNACYQYCGFFGFLGGLAVTLWPTAMLYTYFIPISIQSMFWHVLLFINGLYILVSKNYFKSWKKDVLPSLIVFGIIVFIAVIVNEIVYFSYISTDKNIHHENVAYFFISNHYPTDYPLLGIVQDNCHYLVFLLAYLAMITSGISIVFFIPLLINKLFFKRTKS